MILSCKHANICKECYKQIVHENSSLFITDDGAKIEITAEQKALYKNKTQWGLPW